MRLGIKNDSCYFGITGDLQTLRCARHHHHGRKRHCVRTICDGHNLFEIHLVLANLGVQLWKLKIPHLLSIMLHGRLEGVNGRTQWPWHIQDNLIVNC